ncbi:hypothetical protein [Celeribacter litoreus]|uniref:hypothetical protein n=1 Tax=Celeribacter litoreus TaxID=2876714 RepID=UPI001CCC63E4|nr:hypothetical protein [Celeribacter litoreus]MCA0044674.1 hypothetical protein [Celeribacter litoreus]
MTHVLKRLVLLLVLALGLTQPVTAADTYSFTYNDPGEMDPERAYSWDAKIDLFSLLGEPVVSTRFRYEIAPGWTYVDLPALDGSGTYFRVGLSNLPTEAQMLYQAYNVKIAFRFRTGESNSRIVKVITDVGDPGKPDGTTWSFNVPESPNWDNFLMEDKGSDFLGASDAKKAFASGLTLVDAHIVSINFTAYDLQEWYRRNTDWPSVRAAITAYNHLADGVERSTGFKAQRKLAKPANPSMSNVGYTNLSAHRSTLSSIMEDYNKLLNLPAEFLSDMNPAPYEAARTNAPNILSQARAIQSNWTPRDVNPASLKKGYAPAGAGPEVKFVQANGSSYYPVIDGQKITARSYYIADYQSPENQEVTFGHLFLSVGDDCTWRYYGDTFYGATACNYQIYDLRTGERLHKIGRAMSLNTVERYNGYDVEKTGTLRSIQEPTLRFLSNTQSKSEYDVFIGECEYWRKTVTGDELVFDQLGKLISNQRATYRYLILFDGPIGCQMIEKMERL